MFVILEVKNLLMGDLSLLLSNMAQLEIVEPIDLNKTTDEKQNEVSKRCLRIRVDSNSSNSNILHR